MEIELRTFINGVNRFKSKLKKFKAKYIGEEHIIDYWFCEKNKNNFKQVSMNKVGSYGLRIRRIIDTKNEKSEICCRVLRKKGDHNAFYEYETNVGDYKQLRKIFESIGFKEFCVVDKKRIIYKSGKATINIEVI